MPRTHNELFLYFYLYFNELAPGRRCNRARYQQMQNTDVKIIDTYLSSARDLDDKKRAGIKCAMIVAPLACPHGEAEEIFLLHAIPQARKHVPERRLLRGREVDPHQGAGLARRMKQRAGCDQIALIEQALRQRVGIDTSVHPIDRNFLFVRSASRSSATGSGLVSGGMVPQSVMPTASRGLCKGRYGK